MKQFDIRPVDSAMRQSIIDKIDNLTKPKGSLGRLEELALQIALIQHTLHPELKNPHNILFAADHGIIEEGVTVSPKEVTWQQLSHFSKGGAGINFLCEQNGFKLVLVDAGVDYDIPAGHGIIDRKIRHSTRNFLFEPAMTYEELDRCLDAGAKTVDDVHADGCNIVSFGEMGSGNTSSSSMWMHLFTSIPLADCIGAGAGLDNNGIRHKYNVLNNALNKFKNTSSNPNDPLEIMTWFGGYELAMAVGGMLRAAELGMIIIIDGFIMTACVLAASTLYHAILDYCIFGHQGDESGHKLMLKHMNARAVLHLDLRLGEGSGAVCAYPIIMSAVNMINNMDSFQSVNVTKYF